MTHYLQNELGIWELETSPIGLRRLQLRQDLTILPPVHATRLRQESEWSERVIVQLSEYFDGSRKTFSIPFDWSDHSEFHQRVWRALLDIPYGRTTTYSRISEIIGNPKAVRAVGMANRANPIAILVPCHRVIAKSGKLQGYFYGLEVKRRLLQLENPHSFATQTSLW